MPPFSSRLMTMSLVQESWRGKELDICFTTAHSTHDMLWFVCTIILGMGFYDSASHILCIHHVLPRVVSSYKPVYHSIVSSLSLVNTTSFIWTPGLRTCNIRLRLPNSQPIIMISEATILVLITILITLFFQPDLLTQWNTFSKEKKEELISSVQDIVKEIKKDLHPKTKLKTEAPKDFEGNSDDIANWCQRMTLYFNNQGVNNEWEKIEFALSKIMGGREN